MWWLCGKEAFDSVWIDALVTLDGAVWRKSLPERCDLDTHFVENTLSEQNHPQQAKYLIRNLAM